MATSEGFDSSGGDAASWNTYEGPQVPLIRIAMEEVHSIDEVIEQPCPAQVTMLVNEIEPKEKLQRNPIT